MSLAALNRKGVKKIKVTRMNTRDWTTVPGWDAAKQEYVELPCERWIRENKIRELGQENGKQEYPPSEAIQADDVYTKILAWVNQRGKTCHAAVSKHLVVQRHALEMETNEGMAPIQDTVKSRRDQGIVELKDQAKKDRSVLTHMASEAREALAALAAFKAKAKLERVAEYNERNTWYRPLACVVAIETLANAMFLADVSEFGLLGAIAIMLAIGLLNTCIFGWLISEGWRQKNSMELQPRLGGWMMATLGVLVMILWNVLVGHFRDSMLKVAEKARSESSSWEELFNDDTIDRFLNQPMGLESMQSWVLAALGAGCCLFAVTKWLKCDDAYPGYGTVHRAATDHNEKYGREVAQRQKDLHGIYMTYIERIRDERQKMENRKGNHRLVTDAARNIVRQFPMQLRQYQDHLDFIIAAYRSANEKSRTTPTPEFFAERFFIDGDMLEPPEWDEIPPPKYEDVWKGFQEAEDAIRKEYQHVQDGYPTLEDLIKDGDAPRGHEE